MSRKCRCFQSSSDALSSRCFSFSRPPFATSIHASSVFYKICISTKRSDGLYCLNVIYTFYFHFIIHKTSISYCLYYNTAKFVPVCTFPVCVIFIDFSLFAVLGSFFSPALSLSLWSFCVLAAPFTFDFSYCTERKEKKPYEMNKIPVRIRITRELTGFCYFSFWQYADEIWCMLNVLETMHVNNKTK